MIKFAANLPDNKKLVGMGLSEGNITRLKDKQPIIFNLGDLLGENYKHLDLVLFYGKDELTITKEIAEFIGPKTTIYMGGHKKGGPKSEIL